jgi:regulator of RNase E activity RraA
MEKIMIEKFKGLYNGVVYDTMAFDIKVKKPFMLRKEVKPAWGFQEVLFGPAFTCKGERVLDDGHIDDTVRIKMFKQFYEGCVQVISSGGYREVAQFGDISGKLARKFGAAGAVLDAPTRDIKLIRSDAFPLFADGVQSTDAYGKWQIAEFEVPIIMPGIHGDVEINPGDFVFGDPDGVLIIPQGIAGDVLEMAQKRMAQEDLVRGDIEDVSDIQEMYDRRGRW